MESRTEKFNKSINVFCHILKDMRTIKQIEALINAGRITEKEAISYIIDFYGDESENLEIFPVNEEYCAVDSSGRSQNVNFGDYTCTAIS